MRIYTHIHVGFYLYELRRRKKNLAARSSRMHLNCHTWTTNTPRPLASWRVDVWSLTAWSLIPKREERPHYSPPRPSAGGKLAGCEGLVTYFLVFLPGAAATEFYKEKSAFTTWLENMDAIFAKSVQRTFLHYEVWADCCSSPAGFKIRYSMHIILHAVQWRIQGNMNNISQDHHGHQERHTYRRCTQQQICRLHFKIRCIFQTMQFIC